MIEDLPQPILDDVLASVSFKRDYQPLAENLQIKELLYCLRQAYLRRVQPKPITSLKVALKIYSGLVWDRQFCRLFPVSQKYVRYECRSCPACVNGKFDFLDSDTVTELKIVNDVNCVSEVPLAYSNQVRFYAFADGKSKAQVVYFDGRDVKKFPVDVGDCSVLMRHIEANARILYYSLLDERLPAKSCFAGVCAGCEFKGEC
ncbi:MAG: hypothetical protein WC325_11160 [Candidatus Bathyarchaeia archaeon]